ncbi:ribonuclease [Streptomyces gardneri]|uniref:ribonuclease domain-containing protein n=1 Tax=Nocardia TaxID=1817 RepID=UPI001357F56E|nr:MULTISPECIES: ribonuclease domain-containing protein [Nocardia]MBF6168277.1 ribonuclease [Streptomyces gardneri]MBF6204643.1 ribonuclease [Streptomyces gardneri]
MNGWSIKRGLGVLGAVAAVLIVAVFALYDSGDSSTQTSRSTTVAASTVTPTAAPRAGETASPVTQAVGVPERAYATLREIDAGRWPGSANAPGTKGGERWMNRGGDLPATDGSGKPITYQEWDVNPKQPGRSRDAERIVTGSDGSAWYTGDHYKTFTRMR